LRFAVVRVGLTIVLGLVFALWLPGRLGIDAKWGVAGLTSSAGIAAWIEYFLLRRALHARIGSVSLAPARVPALWACALVAGGLSWGVRLTSTALPPFAHSLAVVTTYGVTYLVATDRAGFPFMSRLIAKVRRRR
jgi:putative peptidoglycan lipid II flippase